MIFAFCLLISVFSQDCQLGENCGGQTEWNDCGSPCPLVCGQSPSDWCQSSCNAAYFCPYGEAFNTYTGACENDECANNNWEYSEEEALCTSDSGVDIYEAGSWVNPDNACDLGECTQDGYFFGIAIDCQPYGCDDDWCVNCDEGEVFVTPLGQCCGECVQEGSGCMLYDGETFVEQGWSGYGVGDNCCNECMCDEWGLTCTEMFCSDCGGGGGGGGGDDCHPDTWNVGYGTCETYGTDGFNNAYCDYDCNSCGCASDICDECSEGGGDGGFGDGGYCTWSPNYDCFSGGWPECCMLDDYECPDEQPDCEVSDSDCEQDIDGDGNVAFPDVLEILSAWGDCDSCAADLDLDGGVNMDDLVAVLANWGCGI